MATKRKKVPEDIEAKVIFLADRYCCCCNKGTKRGDQIHHIDGNNSNSAFENLAFLCFDCHNDAESISKLKKRLTPKTIIQFRDYHYDAISKQRATSKKSLDKPIQTISTEALLTAAVNAIIIIDIAKLKEEFYNSDWDDRVIIIEKLFKYADHCDIRISYEVFIFISEVSYQTRGGMPFTISASIFNLILNFFPESYFKLKNKQVKEIGIQCVSIAFNIIYDSAIYLKNIATLQEGLLILKYFYDYSNKYKIADLTKNINKTFEELLFHLNRPERTDLENAKELILVYKNALNDSSDNIPNIPRHLNVILLEHSKLD
jgi:hypothetical protein